jgi:hypothetical protein
MAAREGHEVEEVEDPPVSLNRSDRGNGSASSISSTSTNSSCGLDPATAFFFNRTETGGFRIKSGMTTERGRA